MSFFDLPMTAGPRDPQVGVDELGRPVYEAIDGTRYGAAFAAPDLPPMQGPERGPQGTVGSRARRDTRGTPGNPNALRQTFGPVVNALAQGFTAPGRALQGEPVTMGDTFATALDFGLLGAPMAAPRGALRAGGMRNADEGFTAYHGSPHDFDRFEMDKIGTGEGAQAYGHGLYFAESEGVAKSYRDALARPYYATQDGANVAEKYGQDVVDAFESVGGDPTEIEDTINRLRSIVQRNLADFGARDVSELQPQYVGDLASSTIDMARRADGLSALLKSGDVRRANEGRMYEVRINANPDDFLDWDAPLSEQPEGVRRAIVGINAGDDPLLRELLDTSPEGMMAQGMVPNARGSAVYRTLIDNQNATPYTSAYDRAQVSATDKLREAGIPGIRYRDAGSRGLDGAEGTRNFVVFDENLIEIVRKYGIAGAAAMLGVSAADVEGAMAGQ